MTAPQDYPPASTPASTIGYRLVCVWCLRPQGQPDLSELTGALCVSCNLWASKLNGSAGV